MKNFRNLLIAFVVLVAGFHTQAATANGLDDKLIEDIKGFAASFEKAMDVRNYAEAKEALDELFPLIKKEMKLAKKEVGLLEKSGEQEAAKAVDEALDRKTEIHDQLHAMVDASTAGLRARADNVMSLVSEYIELLEENQKLVSSNN